MAKIGSERAGDDKTRAICHCAVPLCHDTIRRYFVQGRPTADYAVVIAGRMEHIDAAICRATRKAT